VNSERTLVNPILEDIARVVAGDLGELVPSKGWGGMFSQQLTRLSILQGIVPSGRELVELAHFVGGTLGRHKANETLRSELAIREGQTWRPMRGADRPPYEVFSRGVWWRGEGDYMYVLRVYRIDSHGNRVDLGYRSLFTADRASLDEVKAKAGELWGESYGAKGDTGMDFEVATVVRRRTADEEAELEGE
jgi:hypothetical protein